MKSIDSMKTYSLGTSKYLLREKVESKCNNLIKQCRKWFTLWCYKRKNEKE